MSGPALVRRSRWLTPVVPGTRVTRLELFFDLIFVFAFLNVTGLISTHPTPRSLVSGLLVLTLLWWCWTVLAALGNLVRIDKGILPVFGLGIAVATFVLAITIPQAFQNQLNDLAGPVVFALAYLALRGLTLGAFLFVLTGTGRDRRQLALVSAPPLVAGVLVILAGTAAWWAPPDVRVDVRLGLWAAALLTEYSVGLILPYSKWAVASAGHWAERHSLIVLIALGEAVISLGLGPGRFERLALSGPVITGSALGILLLAALWWLHFDTLAPSVEQAMHGTRDIKRVSLARDVFTYLHLLMITSVIAVALGLKVVLQAAAEISVEPLSWSGVAALYGGVALYLLTEVAVVARTFRRVRPTRLATAAVVALLSWPATLVTPLAALGGLIVVLIALIVVDRFTGTAARSRIKAFLREEEEVSERAVSQWRQQHL
ncbi:low temperature requirement protein A [Micromonospora sp. WMMD1120]|uniref:low temperature requirement protein A n=1 Tax=Micromonospora sp. WMMD1120 TaxID=3016106 RepID=UPI002417A0F3|nr:low temperature requirement protein A [Micromonospora sp. WMMD1120]MDG4811127.1 low temperature requirement protein A [Micromonospora sp. WMMD1120]